jgi:hypothetical protein
MAHPKGKLLIQPKGARMDHTHAKSVSLYNYFANGILILQFFSNCSVDFRVCTPGLSDWPEVVSVVQELTTKFNRSSVR